MNDTLFEKEQTKEKTKYSTQERFISSSLIKNFAHSPLSPRQHNSDKVGAASAVSHIFN